MTCQVREKDVEMVEKKKQISRADSDEIKKRRKKSTFNNKIKYKEEFVLLFKMRKSIRSAIHCVCDRALNQ